VYRGGTHVEQSHHHQSMPQKESEQQIPPLTDREISRQRPVPHVKPL
jgi:hypothetical protein